MRYTEIYSYVLLEYSRVLYLSLKSKFLVRTPEESPKGRYFYLLRLSSPVNVFLSK